MAMTRPLILLALFSLSGLGCVSASRQQQSVASTDLGTAYLREGNPAAALGALQQAVKRDPRNWEAWDRLGLAYWAQQDFVESEKAFLRGEKVAPGKAEILNNHALMLMAQGENARAVELLQQARGDLVYRRMSMVLSNLGRALQLEGRQEEALEVLDQALVRTPNFCPAQFHRALVLEDLDRLDGALASYELVIRACGDEAIGAYFHAGQLLAKRGDRQAACTYFSTAQDRSRPGGDLFEAARKARAIECP